MITARIIEIDRPFHKTQPQHLRIKIHRALRIPANERNMMYDLNSIVGRHALLLLDSSKIALNGTFITIGFQHCNPKSLIAASKCMALPLLAERIWYTFV